MNFLQKSIISILTVTAALGPAISSASATSEIHITPDGKLSAKNITVMQKSGTNFFSRATWGQVYIRMVILTNNSAAISKNHGEKMTNSDINEGDLLDIDGTLSSGADSLIVNATRIRNISVERESKTVSGTIQGLGSGNLSFTLTDKSLGDVTITAGSSTPITKGARSISFSELATGDKILSASGTYDYTTNVLLADDIQVYQSKSMFAPRNFQGLLKSMSGNTLPATLGVSAGGIDYTVYLSEHASVLKNNKTATTLSRFIAGDTVRFYGNIRETNFKEIDADVVRDLNF